MLKEINLLKKVLWKALTVFMFITFAFINQSLSQNTNRRTRPSPSRNANSLFFPPGNLNLSPPKRSPTPTLTPLSTPEPQVLNTNQPDRLPNEPSPSASLPPVTPVQSQNPMPKPDNISLILTLLLTISTIVLSVLSYKLSKQKSALDDKLETARKYIQSLHVIDYVFQDIILLGPRNSGKTSVAELWSKPATDITRIPHTRKWELHERDILEFNEYEKRHDTLDIIIKYKRRLRIKVHDYPGEDRFRTEAIESLPELKKSVLLLFFDVSVDREELQRVSANNGYYSQVFVNHIRKLRDFEPLISKVIVVFNKADLLPPDMLLDVERTKDELKKINAEAIDRIEGQFSGILDYLVVSAHDNRGLIALLGAAVTPTLPVEEREVFQSKLNQLALDND
jgi:GTPase SAR1 family protein